MRRLKVDHSEAAEADLENVFRFLQRRGAGRRVASAYVGSMEAACERIGDTPGMGAAREDLGPGPRSTGFERRASIVFRVEGERVLIVDVFYGGRDIEGYYRERGGSAEEG